jgi:CTP:molybdopterin cytidylyltransferase MocA
MTSDISRHSTTGVREPRAATLAGARLTFSEADADGKLVLGVLGPINEDSGENMLALKKYLAFFAAEKVDAIVVTGDPHTGTRIEAALRGCALRCVACADWPEGMGASLRAGLAALGAVDGVLISPCDVPGLRAEHACALIDAWRAHPDRAVASAYAGVIGTPAALPRAAFAELARIGGDRGARDWLRSRTDVACIVDEALARDIDVPEDLG